MWCGPGAAPRRGDLADEGAHLSVAVQRPSLFGSSGQVDGEHASLARQVPDADRAAVSGHGLTAAGQPESQPGTVGPALFERLEQFVSWECSLGESSVEAYPNQSSALRGGYLPTDFPRGGMRAPISPPRKRPGSIAYFRTLYPMIRSVLPSSRAALARLPRALFSASTIRSFSYCSTASHSEVCTTVPEASAVCNVGGRWWPWITCPSQVTTAR